MRQDTPKKPRFIKPPNIIKQKVGHGGIDAALIEKSQDYIEKTDLDFIPYAREYLKQMMNGLTEAQESNDNFLKTREKVIGPVMQLKANGGMFRYQLVSDVADIALQFLEAIEEINEDAVDVIRAHENTIQIIIKNKLTGDGGKEGYALVVELDKACKRYFAKYQESED